MPARINNDVLPILPPRQLSDRLGISADEVLQFLKEKNRFFYVWREDAVHVAQR
jgi:argonaute-like protein implicated in RNA metabolism and viral defense